MPKVITIGEDVGNGETSVATLYKNDWYTTHFPSLRLKIPNEDRFGDDEHIDRFHWSTVTGGRSTDDLDTYIVGEDALSKGGIIEHDRSEDRFANEFETFLLCVALYRINQQNQRVVTKRQMVRRATCVPPKMLNQQMRDRYEDTLDTYYLYVNDEQKPYTFTFSDIYVFEEGRGAMAVFLLNKDGRQTEYFEDMIKGSVSIIDIGYKTLDRINYSNGSISNTSRYEMTNEMMGIYPGIVRKVVTNLRGRSGKVMTDGERYSNSWAHVSEYQVEMALRAYCKGDIHNCSLWVDDKFFNIANVLSQFAEAHARLIKQTIESDELTNGVASFRKLIFVGGGQEVMQMHFKTWYPNKYVDLSRHPSTCGIDDAAVILNSVGNWLLYNAR